MPKTRLRHFFMFATLIRFKQALNCICISFFAQVMTKCPQKCCFGPLCTVGQKVDFWQKPIFSKTSYFDFLLKYTCLPTHQSRNLQIQRFLPFFLASGSTANPAKSMILAYFKEIWYLMFFAAM